ncbi:MULTISPECIES: cytochrome-c peroxidase [unclassified Nostoc]|uniref:cytochrome-c peroxidase n=1 Tax=unclassified Nostoc TaxID=2593658 RepID=UPI00300792E7
MVITAIIILVVLFTSLPIYLLLTSRGRFLLKSAVTKVKQAIQSLVDKLKLPLFDYHKSDHKVVSLSNLSFDMKRRGWRFNSGHSSRLVSKLSRTTTIAVVIIAAVIAGNTVSAQVTTGGLVPLSKVGVPKPTNLAEFVKDEKAAIALGKSLFWDMQLGFDGIQSCASCHFHAGADSRSKNQINPGLVDTTFTTFTNGGGPNNQLTALDYPFHKLADPNDRTSNVVFDTNDVTGSEGVFRAKFQDVVPGSDKDKVTFEKDDVFNVNGTNVRRVTPRNSPTVINAVFNFRNFWNGLAQNNFNGVNPLGLRDPNAYVLKATKPRRLEDVQVKLNNSSLASQAVGPPLNAFETAGENTVIVAPLRADLSETEDKVTVSDSKGQVIDTQLTSDPEKQSKKTSAPKDTKPLKKFGRKLGKKLLALQPLAKQTVAYDDSVLGSLSKSSAKSAKKGLNKSYEALIKDAFKSEWWQSNIIVRINQDTGERTFVRKPQRFLKTNEYTLMEYNFSLYFGLAIQAYESTLVSDNTPFDKFLSNPKIYPLADQQQKGWNLFQGNGCIACHGGSELTLASVSSVAQRGRIARAPFPPTTKPPEDTGFFRIGVRPDADDPGLGGNDGSNDNNPLSEARLAQQGKFDALLGEKPPTLNPPLNSTESVIADGAFKAPGLRNVELTAPYFHNGGQATLEQVIDFYNRGGDLGFLGPLGLKPEDKQALVAFLKALTDERVRYEKAPFDHPQLFVPNGHPGDSTYVTDDGTGKATDSLLEIPAVGQNGGKGTPNFLATSIEY